MLEWFNTIEVPKWLEGRAFDKRTVRVPLKFKCFRVLRERVDERRAIKIGTIW